MVDADVLSITNSMTTAITDNFRGLFNSSTVVDLIVVALIAFLVPFIFVLFKKLTIGPDSPIGDDPTVALHLYDPSEVSDESLDRANEQMSKMETHFL